MYLRQLQIGGGGYVYVCMCVCVHAGPLELLFNELRDLLVTPVNSDGFLEFRVYSQAAFWIMTCNIYQQVFLFTDLHPINI